MVVVIKHTSILITSFDHGTTNKQAAEREPERVRGLLGLRAAAANNAGTITPPAAPAAEGVGEREGEGRLRACLRFATALGLEGDQTSMSSAAFGMLLRLMGPRWALGVEEEEEEEGAGGVVVAPMQQAEGEDQEWGPKTTEMEQI